MSDFGRSFMGRGAGLGDRDLYARDFLRTDALLDARLGRDRHALGPGREPGLSDPGILRGLDPLSVQAQVIVIDPERRCRDYAEMFLAKVKKTGLVCDIIICDRFTSPSQVIDDATARGMLYTASVNLQNEIHGSITINILQGQPQEHRNMPYEDALKLISRNFDAHLLKLGGGAKDDATPVVPGPQAKEEPAEEMDPALSLLLINLAEGKNLRLPELDKVIAFLNKKRAKLAPANTTTPAQPIPTTYQQQEKKSVPPSRGAPKPVQPPSKAGNAASSQAEDLQAKINQLFGNTSKQQSTVGLNPSTTSSGNTYTSPTDAKKKSAIDFNNPAVQTALQNLMKTGPNILSTIRNTTASSSSTSTYSSSYGTAGATSSKYSPSDSYKNEKEDRKDSSRPAKRAKPGRHAIAGFY